MRKAEPVKQVDDAFKPFKKLRMQSVNTTRGGVSSQRTPRISARHKYAGGSSMQNFKDRSLAYKGAQLPRNGMGKMETMQRQI